MTTGEPMIDENQRRKEFAQILAFVAAAFPSAVHIDAATILVYYRTLNAVPLELLRRVAETILTRTPAFEFFPAAPTWLEIAGQVSAADRQENTTKMLNAKREDYHCSVCQDTGWEYLTRQVGERTATTVRPCECRKTNPVYQAKQPPKKFLPASTRRTRDVESQEDATALQRLRYGGGDDD